MDSSPVEKDVVIAILGAAAALAGLVLVFLGVVIAAIQSFPPDTLRASLAPYRLSAGFGLGAFGVSLASLVVSVAWLVEGAGDLLYHAALAVFFVQLLALALVAVVVSYQLVFKG